MSIFGTILSKIFSIGGTQLPPSGTSPVQSPATPQHPISSGAKPAEPANPNQPVDVEKVLTELAAKKGGGGNWQTSIVDLLKMLDLDSSLSARKDLAKELDVHAGADGSAEQNIALQKAVWKKLSENGGHVPASLRD
ncbi:MAG: DUF3597 domain-containing protein [Alphaproteobacteria bacterium]|nr:DUF3597 domain-containing protein [Alphaproteobacteria bacterium]